MPIREIYKKHTYVYLSLEESIRQNGYRHEFRGYNWLELGYDDRAKGSFRKAKRNYEKAEEYKAFYKLDPFFQLIVDRLSKRIEGNIMNGVK